MHIVVVSGSSRDGRKSKKVAEVLFSELAKRKEVSSEFVDVEEHQRVAKTVQPSQEGGSETVPTPWRESMERADGLIIVTPEYNRGYPGELKLLLDSLYREYRRKPIGLVGVSDGPWGGTRAIEELRLVTAGLGAVSVPVSVPVPFVDRFFDASGAPSPSDSARIETFLSEVLWYAQALKVARDTETS